MLAILRNRVVGLLLFVIGAVAEVEIAELWQRIKDGETLGIQASQLPESPIRPVVEYEPPEEEAQIAQVPTPPEEVPPAPPDFPWEFTPGKEFDVFALTKEYQWEPKTTKVVSPGGGLADMRSKLESLLGQYGRRYHDLIAVGTASCEGEEEEELVRARDRADQLTDWLRDALTQIGDDRERHLYSLNLGRFNERCSGPVTDATGNQRRVIVIAVKDRRPDMDLDAMRQALWNELDDPGQLPLGFPMNRYLTFLLERGR